MGDACATSALRLSANRHRAWKCAHGCGGHKLTVQGRAGAGARADGGAPVGCKRLPACVPVWPPGVPSRFVHQAVAGIKLSPAHQRTVGLQLQIPGCLMWCAWRHQSPLHDACVLSVDCAGATYRQMCLQLPSPTTAYDSPPPVYFSRPWLQGSLYTLALHSLSNCMTSATLCLNCKMQLCVQGSFYNLSLQWLIKHNFPPGPIHLTRTHKPTMPLYSSVGAFKVTYMQARAMPLCCFGFSRVLISIDCFCCRCAAA